MSRSHGLVVSLFDESGVATDPWWAGVVITFVAGTTLLFSLSAFLLNL